MNTEAPAQPRQRRTIVLSTVYWYDATLPATVDLEDCRLQGLAPGAFHGFYGLRGKQDGFAAAGAHAQATGRNYTAIDVTVAMNQELPRNFIRADDLATLDLLPIHRLTQGFAHELDRRLRSDLARPSSTVVRDGVANALQNTLLTTPGAVATLLDYPELEHIKAATYLARLPISPNPIHVASIPARHLGSIVDARSRFDSGLVFNLPAGASVRVTS